MSDLTTIPETIVGIRLCKIVRGELVIGWAMRFHRGQPAIIAVLRRARISGEVQYPWADDNETDFWADLLDEHGDMIDNVALDRDSWNVLKNRWLRCGIEAPRKGVKR